MSTFGHELAVAFRDIAADVAKYWPRALITFLAGAVVLVLIRYPFFEQSILGEPDRDMMTTAFRLRTDVYIGKGDPVLLIDIDNATIAQIAARTLAPGREPSASAPRGLVADLLQYVLAAPGGRGAKVVMLDVDVAAPTKGDEEGEAKLRKAFADWAANPQAPTLVISREAFPPELVGGAGSVPVLPTSDYDDIISKAPNIYWGEVKALTDINGVAQEMLPYECVQTQGHVEPLFASAILAYGSLENGRIPAKAPVREWMEGAAAYCRAHPDRQIQHGEAIDFHLSLPRDEAGQVWPSLPKDWPGYRVCGRDTDPAVFRHLSAGDIQQAGPDASHDILCQRLVVIGGTNWVANDFLQSPLHEMPGALVLANSTRGLQISHGGLKEIPLLFQLMTLAVISVTITITFTLSKRARRTYREHRRAGSGWVRELVLLPLNPVVLNLGVAFIAHWLGVALMLVALKVGYWGFLSGPAVGSALAETIQDFTDEQI
jgi:hypothetical protein